MRVGVRAANMPVVCLEALEQVAKFFIYCKWIMNEMLCVRVIIRVCSHCFSVTNAF